MKNKASKDVYGLPALVGIVGLAGSGKDVIATHLMSKYDYQRIGLGDAVKEEVLKHFHSIIKTEAERWYAEHIYEGRYTLEEAMYRLVWIDKYYPVRELLQSYATEVRRGDNPSYWTLRWVQRYVDRTGGNVVVPDVRFPNEVDLLTSWQGTIVRVLRPGCTPVNDHVSEQLGEVSVNHTFVNDTTIKNLQDQVEKWINGSAKNPS